MAGLRYRIRGFLLGQDIAICGLCGGAPWQTLSGTIGRGLEHRLWWAEPARKVVDGIFGHGHCADQARKEALIEAVLLEHLSVQTTSP